MSTAQNAGEGATVLPPKKSRTGLYIGIAVAAIVAIVAAVLVFVNLNSNAAPAAGGSDTGAITEGLGSPDQPVRLGTVGASEEYWTTFTEAAAAEGISLEVINFDSYPEPNPALAAGDLDINQFQHIVYLGEHEANNSDGLVPIGATAIYPLGLYSTEFGSIDEIPAGSTVAIPDDPSNLARGLLILQSAGLVEIEGGGSIFATLDQVLPSSKVKVTTLEAALTVTSLPDVAAAIINNDFLADAGLTADDALAKDDPSDPNALPYVNIFAVNEKDKDNAVLLKLVEIFQDNQDVLDGVQETAAGTAVFLKTPVADLQESLKKVIADNKAK